IFLWLHILFLRFTLDFLTMFIRSGQVHDIVSAQPFITCHGITGNCGIGMSYVQIAARIIDWCCYIKCILSVWHGLTSSIVISIVAIFNPFANIVWRVTNHYMRDKGLSTIISE